LTPHYYYEQRRGKTRRATIVCVPRHRHSHYGGVDSAPRHEHKAYGGVVSAPRHEHNAYGGAHVVRHAANL
jgi:hypothetical protein